MISMQSLAVGKLRSMLVSVSMVIFVFGVIVTTAGVTPSVKPAPSAIAEPAKRNLVLMVTIPCCLRRKGIPALLTTMAVRHEGFASEPATAACRN